jgi:DNA-binding NarL/FixJ family response regulator
MDRMRVLLADDHPRMVSRLTDLLEPEFKVIAVVGDGQSLIETAKSLQPDLIITDISIPILSGIDAAKQILQHTPQTKIIFLTVHTDPDYVHAALELGAVGYVFKSRLVSDLRLAIEEVLEDRTYVSSSP